MDSNSKLLRPFKSRVGNTTISVTSRRMFDKLISLGVTDQRLTYKGLHPPKISQVCKRKPLSKQTLITSYLNKWQLSLQHS
jgi:hypothetical protein